MPTHPFLQNRMNALTITTCLIIHAVASHSAHRTKQKHFVKLCSWRMCASLPHRCLCCQVMCVHLNHWRLDRRLGVGLLFLYVIFLLCSIFFGQKWGLRVKGRPCRWTWWVSTFLAHVLFPGAEKERRLCCVPCESFCTHATSQHTRLLSRAQLSPPGCAVQRFFKVSNWVTYQNM